MGVYPSRIQHFWFGFAGGEEDEAADEPTVSVPVSALRALRDNWESGDLAGAVNDLLAYLDDEDEEGAGE
mgnify:CR=1 FL=1